MNYTQSLNFRLKIYTLPRKQDARLSFIEFVNNMLTLNLNQEDALKEIRSRQFNDVVASNAVGIYHNNVKLAFAEFWMP